VYRQLLYNVSVDVQIDGVIFHQELRPKLAELFNLKAPKLLYLHKFSMRVGRG